MRAIERDVKVKMIENWTNALLVSAFQWDLLTITDA